MHGYAWVHTSEHSYIVFGRRGRGCDVGARVDYIPSKASLVGSEPGLTVTPWAPNRGH